MFGPSQILSFLPISSSSAQLLIVSKFEVQGQPKAGRAKAGPAHEHRP